jgi:VIT1/CCC1 family predicted Fe2+/Mn2+ transporter
MPPPTATQSPRTDLWLQNLLDERDGAALYEGLAKYEKDPEKARSFAELARAERRHAEIWQRKLEKAGVTLPPDRASSRVRALVWLARRLGSASVVPMVLETEAGDAEKYDQQGGDATDIAAEEREHRAVLAGMRHPGDPEGARGLIAQRERWHRGGGRAGSVRAAIFGMNDGLVSNLSLILGVAGAGVEPRTVLVTGFAGLLAGAFSMAAGEYSSVASQRDLLARQVAMERREIAEAPEEEAAELALIFKQKGLSTEQASRTAAEILKNPESALDTLVREELGLDPEDLGSPMGAATSSLAMFSIGALVPILPFLFTSGAAAVGTSAGLALGVLVGVGGFVGFLSGTSVWRSALRMAGLAAIAAGVTYAVGRLFGATLS